MVTLQEPENGSDALGQFLERQQLEDRIVKFDFRRSLARPGQQELDKVSFLILKGGRELAVILARLLFHEAQRQSLGLDILQVVRREFDLAGKKLALVDK